MKRFLSVLLALVFAFPLISTSAFALDAETEEFPHVITYEFGEAAFENSAEAFPGILGVTSKKGGEYKLLSYTKPNSNAVTSRYFKYVTNPKTPNQGAILLEINVDKPGMYIPSIKYHLAARGGYLKAFVIKDPSKLSITTSGENSNLISELSNYSYLDNTHINTHANADDLVNTTEHTYKEVVSFDKAGTYYLVLFADGADEAANTSIGKTMIYPASFTLTETHILDYQFNYNVAGGEGAINLADVAYGTYASSKDSSSAPWIFAGTSTCNSINLMGDSLKAVANQITNVGYAMFELTVDKNAVYLPSVTLLADGDRPGRLDVYMFSDKDLEKEGLTRDSSLANITAAMPKLNKSTIVTSTTDTTTTELNEIEVNTSGNNKYYVLFKAIGVGKKIDDRVNISNFTLRKTAELPPYVAPGDAVESPTAAFTADAEAGGTVTDKGEVKQVEIGGSVTVEATANEGYTFAYWRNAGGKHLSSNARETFKVNTNTAVIAVFDKVVEESDETVPVYFYNENGSLITKKSVTKGTDFATAAAGVSKSLTGKIFESWSIDNSFIINEPTYAVAQYVADPTEYNVTVGGSVKATGAYGEKATVTGSESFSYWKLGDNIVSYNKAYSFYIWGNVTLEEITGEEASAAPTIAINKQGENYFISYNTPTGYTLLEAGIVFGQTGSTPKIDGFYSKAVSELNNGQFTSKSGDGSETVARGYIVFRDNSDSSVRVIYAD